MWINDVFYYTIRNLKGIAYNYERLYTDAPNGALFETALMKADFDRALRSIGRGNWTGEVRRFGTYKYYSRGQQVVIADIIFGKESATSELARYGFYHIPQLRHKAYKKMLSVVNDGKF